MPGYNEAAALQAEGLKVILEPIPLLTPKGVLGRNGILLQCPPLEDFSHDHAHDHNDYMTARTGQFSRRSGRTLRSISFETLVVDYAEWTFYNSEPIDEICEDLIEVCESGAPFLLTCAHDVPGGGYGNWSETVRGPETQWPATLRSLKVSERASEPEARYLSMAFTEFRDGAVLKRKRKGPKKGNKDTPTFVTLFMDGSCLDAKERWIGNPPKQPVTLNMLAKKFYGDSQHWRDIARVNSIYNFPPSDSLITYPGYRTQLKKGGHRVPLAKTPAAKFRHVRVAKIKIPRIPKQDDHAIGKAAFAQSQKAARAGERRAVAKARAKAKK